MTNSNETTSIETLSDDELNLVSGGCSGSYYKAQRSYQPYTAAPSGSGGGDVTVAQANLSINGSVIDDSVIFQNVDFDNVTFVF